MSYWDIGLTYTYFCNNCYGSCYLVHKQVQSCYTRKEADIAYEWSGSLYVHCICPYAA